MSDVEALFWALDADPLLTSSFANLTLLDRPPDPERLRRRVARVALRVPRLHQRVVPVPGRLAPPRWAPAPVDLDHHLRHVPVDPPGGERELLELAARLAAEPFDLDRPLWRFWVLDGLADGRGAVLQHVHHTVTDGEGGVRLSAELIDLERDAPEADDEVELPVADAGTDAADAAATNGGGAAPADLAALVAELVDAAGHAARRVAGIARRAARDAAALAAEPRRIPAVAELGASTALALARQALPHDGARSPLWRERGLGRRLEVLTLPLDDVKRAAKALGGSVNDLFVAGVAGGAGAYHRERGVEVPELRMAMPMSLRSRGGAVGPNAFTLSRTVVPVGPDPRSRFREVHERLARTKVDPGVKALGTVAGLAAMLPLPLLSTLARAEVRTVDFTTSNVRGAPFDLYLAGARVKANHPLGPLGGTAFNATTLSVAGSLDVGIHVDTDAVEDPAALRAAIEASFSELLALG